MRFAGFRCNAHSVPWTARERKAILGEVDCQQCRYAHRSVHPRRHRPC